MTDWTPVWTAGITATATLLAGSLGVWISLHMDSRRAEREHDHQLSQVRRESYAAFYNQMRLLPNRLIAALELRDEETHEEASNRLLLLGAAVLLVGGPEVRRKVGAVDRGFDAYTGRVVTLPEGDATPERIWQEFHVDLGPALDDLLLEMNSEVIGPARTNRGHWMRWKRRNEPNR